MCKEQPTYDVRIHAHLRKLPRLSHLSTKNPRSRSLCARMSTVLPQLRLTLGAADLVTNRGGLQNTKHKSNTRTYVCGTAFTHAFHRLVCCSAMPRPIFRTF